MSTQKSRRRRLRLRKLKKKHSDQLEQVKSQLQERANPSHFNRLPHLTLAATMAAREQDRQSHRSRWRKAVIEKRECASRLVLERHARRETQMRHLTALARPSAYGMLALANRSTTPTGRGAAPKTDSPGPVYDIPSTLVNSGGVISKASSLTELDILASVARKQPGPGAYRVPTPKLPGGRFNHSEPKGEIEWIEYRAKQLPGPGAYRVPSPKLPGGRFNHAEPKSDLEQRIWRASQVPGPSYDIGTFTHNPTAPVRPLTRDMRAALRPLAPQ